MPTWAVALWRVNNATGNRLWRRLPYRLRHAWAVAWTRAGSPSTWTR